MEKGSYVLLYVDEDAVALVVAARCGLWSWALIFGGIGGPCSACCVCCSWSPEPLLMGRALSSVGSTAVAAPLPLGLSRVTTTSWPAGICMRSPSVAVVVVVVVV
jgi:hypothetical protein